jgi:hypothetical protein
MHIVRNKEGQAVSEYMLLLVVCIGLLMIVITKLIAPAYNALTKAVSRKVESTIFSMDMHYYKVR